MMSSCIDSQETFCARELTFAPDVSFAIPAYPRALVAERFQWVRRSKHETMMIRKIAENFEHDDQIAGSNRR